MKTYLSLGLMSGTSMDGIDAAIIETDGLHHLRSISESSIRYKPELHHALKAAEYSARKHRGDLEFIPAAFDRDLLEYLESINLDYQGVQEYFGGKLPSFDDIVEHSTDLHISLSQKLLQNHKADIIGYHGQNLYHNPAIGITMQIGNGQKMADALGIEVVNNFRENDVKNGGQGAPFAPIYHQALAQRDNLYPVAIVNCGGIANISIINGPEPDDIIGFDTGPGNCLVDRFIKTISNGQETFDRDGNYGKKGVVSEKIMDILYSDLNRYLDKKPPKSLDIGDLKLPQSLVSESNENVIRTLEEFTAKTIIDSLKHSKIIPKNWILAGGGWNNPVILDSFKQNIISSIPNANVKLATEAGFSNDGLEAEIFAYLAVRSKMKLALSYPTTTGTPLPCTGGRFYLPSIKAKTCA